jgi:hypothetical protein
MIYNEIYNFCKVRNIGTCYKNGDTPTPRVKFITDLLDKQGIEYVLDIYEDDKGPELTSKSRIKSFNDYINGKFKGKSRKNLFFNIILKGTSSKMVIAHHDIVNPNTDNANDNSCSVINAIAIKKYKPHINVVIVDGEEVGGIGSTRLSKQIKNGDFGFIDWVLNLELTGKGGKYFFIGNNPGPLFTKVKNMFNCPTVDVPFNDSVIMRKFGIDSIVINPLPPLPDGEKSRVQFNDGKYLDFNMLFNCHSPKDTVETISPTDMKEFVEEVVFKILQ